MKKTKKAKIFCLKSCVAIVVILATFLLVGCKDKKEPSPKYEFGGDVIEYGGNKYSRKKSVETFLVLGLDKFEGQVKADSYNNDQQADFLMLFVFDNKAKTCTAIHINRDTISDVDVLGITGTKIYTVKQQIALAHTYGDGGKSSGYNVAHSVSDLLMGMKVDYYLSVKMDAVPEYNDLVDGVEVEVLDDFSGIDDTLVKGEKVTLTKDNVLTYVRTRKTLEDSTNSTRMVRQQQYINALYEKTQQVIAEDESFIVDKALKTMSKYIISDTTGTRLQTLAEKFHAYEFKGIKNIDGETKRGEFIEFYPSEASLKKIIVELFYEPKK